VRALHISKYVMDVVCWIRTWLGAYRDGNPYDVVEDVDTKVEEEGWAQKETRSYEFIPYFVIWYLASI